MPDQRTKKRPLIDGKWLVPAIIAVLSALIVILQYEYSIGQKLWSFMNEDFSIAVFSAFIGTTAAAGAIYYLGQIQKRRDLLSAINMSIALMSGHVNTLLNFKVQILLPLQQDKDLFFTFAQYCMETIRLNEADPDRPINLPVPQLRHLMQNIHRPSLEFLVAIEKLSPFAERFPEAIVYAVKAKESMDSLDSMLVSWDKLLEEMRQSQLNGEKDFLKFFGLVRTGNIHDQRVPQTIDNLVREADTSLFFLRATMEEIQKRSEDLLPKDVLKTLAKTKTKKGYEVYMPPRNLVEGWGDD